MSRGEVQQLLREARRRGWATVLTPGGHYKLTHPTGAFIYCSATPRTGRAIKATECRMRKIEREASSEDQKGSDVTAKDTFTAKVLAKSYVWCDYHTEIHEATPNVYQEGAEGRRGCRRNNWRRVYVETDDPLETF